MNWACKGSRLSAPFETITPSDLRGSWRGDASAGEQRPRSLHHPQMGPSSCRRTSSGLPLTLHYGELVIFIICHNVMIIKCTNAMHSNHPLCPWKNCLPENWSLVPKKLGTTALRHTREWSLSSFLSFSPRTPHTKEMPCEDFVRKQPSIMPAWKRTDAARVSSGTPNLWNMRKQMSVIEVTQLAFWWQPEQTGGSQVALL